MIARYGLLVLGILTIISCQKQHPQQSAAPPDVPADTPAVKLKDVIVNSLPSPYYHFEYGDSGYITQANFSSGLIFYDLSYAGKKVSEMAANKDVPFDTNKDKLEYDYSNGNPTAIRVIDKNGIFYKRCLFTFSPSRQLQKLEWDVKMNNADFTTEETLQFSYYSDGNVKELIYQSYPVGPLTAATYKDEFEDYDDKLNADGFSLLHINTNFLHLILLPSVHVQLNNARRVIHTGDGMNYQVDYTYTYDAQKRPLAKGGDLLITNGSNAGQHVKLMTTFSYYD